MVRSSGRQSAGTDDKWGKSSKLPKIIFLLYLLSLQKVMSWPELHFSEIIEFSTEDVCIMCFKIFYVLIYYTRDNKLVDRHNVG